MKKVLIVNFGRQYGGTEKYCEKIMELLKDNYSFYVLLRNESTFHQHIKNKNNIRILAVTLTLSRLLSEIKVIKEYIERNSIDIIHTQGIAAELVVSFLKQKNTLHNVRCVSTVHGIAEMDRIQMSNLKRLLFSRAQVYALKRFDRIIAVSKSIKDDLISKGLDARKIVTIYQSIDIHGKYMQEEYQRHYPLRICCVGRLERVKNINMLINALAQLDSKDFICNIFGEGILQNELQELIIKYDLSDRVFLRGYTDNVEAVYKYHDVLVQPSIYESFGLTVIEAMAYGIPVVCSNVGGMKEIIEHNKSGFLFNVGDEKELQSILARIMENSYDLNIVVKYAADQVKKRFNDADQKLSLENVYEGRASSQDEKK